MSQKTLKIIALSVVLLAILYTGVALLGGRMGTASPGGDSPLQQAIDGLDPSSVDSVVVDTPTGEHVALLGSAEGPWTVNGFRADFQAVVRMRQALEEASVGTAVASNPANHGRLGVASDSTWQATFYQDGKVVSLLFGGRDPSYARSYARLPDADEVYLLGGGLAETMERKASEWRDRTIVNVDTASVHTLVMERDGDTMTLLRSDSTWSVGGAPADSLSMTTLLRQLADLRASGFPDPNAAADSASASSSDDGPRQVVALDAQGDTLTVIDLSPAGPTSWRTRARGDSVLYEVSTFVANELVPEKEKLSGGG